MYELMHQRVNSETILFQLYVMLRLSLLSFGPKPEVNSKTVEAKYLRIVPDIGFYVSLMHPCHKGRFFRSQGEAIEYSC